MIPTRSFSCHRVIPEYLGLETVEKEEESRTEIGLTVIEVENIGVNASVWEMLMQERTYKLSNYTAFLLVVQLFLIPPFVRVNGTPALYCPHVQFPSRQL